MLIKVTDKHIANGSKYNRSHCPVALAVKEALDRDDVTVVSRYTTVGDKRYRNCDTVSDFVYDLDNGRTVEPFEFDLPTEEEEPC